MLQPATSSETRSRSRELKFLVEAETAPAVLAWARHRLGPDPHGSGDHLDAYRVTSLYFDTEQLDVYHRRGSYRRGKYRVRRYDHAEVLFLERKLRTDRVLIKRRTEVSFDGLLALSGNHHGPEWAGHWFRRRLAARELQPVCQVSYDRVARIGETPLGLARLTCDRDLRAHQIRDFTWPLDFRITSTIARS